jgi:hypothetical protein
VVRIALVLALLAAPAAADPACDEITASLAADASQARVWNIAWAVTFGAAAVGIAVAALTIPEDKISDNTRTGLWISTSKATIGAAARVVLPLRVEQPRDCADAPRALALSARRQRNGVILNTVGGLVLNTAGLLYLGLEKDAWRTGVLSFVSGTVVGLFSSYTAPRRAWRGKRVAPAGVVISVVPTLGGAAVVGTW